MTPTPPNLRCVGGGRGTIIRHVTTIRSIRKKGTNNDLQREDASGKSKAVTILRKDSANF